MSPRTLLTLLAMVVLAGTAWLGACLPESRAAEPLFAMAVFISLSRDLLPPSGP